MTFGVSFVLERGKKESNETALADRIGAESVKT